MSNANITITRGQVGALGLTLGGLSLLVGLLAFLWGGLGFALTPIALAVGAAGIVLWAVMLPQEFRDLITGRQIRQGTVAVLSSLLVIGLVVTVYILVADQGRVFDLTEGERFTLDERTLEILNVAERADRPLQITGIYGASQLLQREIDAQYWQLYASATEGHIRVVYVDPNEQPGFVANFESALRQGINTFVSFVNPDGTIDLRETQIVSPGAQEQAMTEAIARLLTQGQFTVYFEQSLETLDNGDESSGGINTLNRLLQSNGLITQPFFLQTAANRGETMPQDASALILARPFREMSAEEVEVVDAYLQEGGALFILTDLFAAEGTFMSEGSPFNVYLWEHFGLRALDAAVVDEGSNAQSALDIVSAAVFSDNEITANINQEGDPSSVTNFRLARAIEVSEDPPVTNGRLIMSSQQSWGERNLDAIFERDQFAFDPDQDIRGPLTTAAWAENTDTGARVILVGDGDFITNGRIQAPQGNALFFLDGVGWLTGFSEEVRFEPQAFRTGLPTLFVDGQMLDTIAFITLILMPGAMLVAAAAIAYRRWRA